MTTTSPILWPAPSRFPALPAGEVHAWCVPLDDAWRPDAGGVTALAPEELRRAGSLRFESDRRRFVASHCLLRAILAGYLGTDPASVRFAYGAHGKPELAAPVARRALQFNLSHSGALALVAVARGTPVGVDLERVRPLDDIELIADQFFAPGEAEELRGLAPAERLPRFLQLWTHKEAVAKVHGLGLDGVLEPARSAALRAGTSGRLAAPRDCRCCEIHPATGYVASLAHSGRLRRREFAWVPPGPPPPATPRRPRAAAAPVPAWLATTAA